MMAPALLSVSDVKPTMTTTKGKHDKQIAPRADRPVVQIGPRELVPVTRLVSVKSVCVINGVLTAVRVLQAA